MPVIAFLLVLTAAGPTFEVVSIKRAAPQPGEFVRSGATIDDNMLVYTSFNLKSIIRNAYEVTELQIAGPDWINDESFDVQAKLPAGAKKSDIPAMLRNMLADRFKLAVRRDLKEMPVYALEVAKSGPRMQAIAEGESTYGFYPRKIEGSALTMEGLAKLLSRVANRPVVDTTGLTGKFTIVLEWAPEPDGPSIYTAVQERLGLRLQPRRMPAETITVTHIERLPTEN